MPKFKVTLPSVARYALVMEVNATDKSFVVAAAMEAAGLWEWDGWTSEMPRDPITLDRITWRGATVRCIEHYLDDGSYEPQEAEVEEISDNNTKAA